MNKTENYIILKPISERFNRISKEITDDEIEFIIKDEMRKQLQKIDFTSNIDFIIDRYMTNNEEEILNMFKSAIKNKLR